ncbi:uncharacterized protein YqcC (DUF446 family) [Pseudomonas fluvialis]|uniref:Uncharacterized protein YqcC (DUF446 family) n=1 Tax=Pseudomonas fluvialis TaxID=1793966 RepID=A0A7X0ET98_9PSED|nr:YqcC family protein [Pseudomonas fluvialis]MBB6343427.1 uncharacterized protein YqcC (DUF446 family) [Pseudomonas fluvialis]
MDARIPLIADQLLLIERQLRQLGLWTQQAPSAEALASQQPFCVDSLAFEEWLQWIFLPRLKSLLEANAPLPAASGIAPMAEQVFVGRALEVKGLIAALEEFDRLIGLGC